MGNDIPFSFELHYTKAADKFFISHEDIREQYENSLKELIAGEHPERIDVKRIKGKRNNYYRIKIGGYRVIYTVIKSRIVVVDTLLAGVRGDIYKSMDGLR